MSDVDEDTPRQQVSRMSGRDIYSVRHDRTTDDTLGTTVVKAVSAVSGVRPTDLEPLHSVLDPDALEHLFQSLDGIDRPHDNYIQFPIADHEVTVYADDVIVVTTPDYDGTVETRR